MTDSFKDLIERLADVEHTRWSHWQNYLHGLCEENEDGSLTIPKDLVERWGEQIATPYDELSEREKDSDRKEVYKTIAEIQKTYDIVDIEESNETVSVMMCGATKVSLN